jgi:hypothetical protein
MRERKGNGEQIICEKLDLYMLTGTGRATGNIVVMFWLFCRQSKGRITSRR